MIGKRFEGCLKQEGRGTSLPVKRVILSRRSVAVLLGSRLPQSGRLQAFGGVSAGPPKPYTPRAGERHEAPEPACALGYLYAGVHFIVNR